MPERIFSVDTEQSEEGYHIYKRGTYSNVELYLGQDYEEVAFVRRNGSNEVLIATQYVARDVLTYTDKVFIDDIPQKYQIWTGPKPEDECAG